MVIFEVMTDTQTHRHTDSKSTYRFGPSGRMGRVKIEENKSGLEFNFPLKSNCASLNFDF